MDVKKVLKEKSKKERKSKERNQINEESGEIKKMPRLTLAQKKIIKSLDKGKTAEEISKDLGMPLEKVKEQIDNLQNLDVIKAQEQKIYLTK